MLIEKKEKVVFRSVVYMAFVAIACVALLVKISTMPVEMSLLTRVFASLFLAALIAVGVALIWRIIATTRKINEMYNETPGSVVRYVDSDKCVDLADIVYRRLHEKEVRISFLKTQVTIEFGGIELTFGEDDVGQICEAHLRHQESGEAFAIRFDGEAQFLAEWHDIVLGAVDLEFLMFVWRLADCPTDYWRICGNYLQRGDAYRG